MDYESARRHRPAPCVDSFPLTLWFCHPARHAQHQQQLKAAADKEAMQSDVNSRMKRKKLLKEYYSPEIQPEIRPTNGLNKTLSLEGLNSSLSPFSADADIQVLIHVQKMLSIQVSRGQYVFLLRLQESLKSLQRTLHKDFEHHGLASQETVQPFGACVGILMSSAEVALLLKPVPTADSEISPLGSELSPFGSRVTLESGKDGGESAVCTVKTTCNIDQLLCADIVVQPQNIPFFVSSSTAQFVDRNAVSGSQAKGHSKDGPQQEEGEKIDCQVLTKSGAIDPLVEPLSWNDKCPSSRLPQSMSR